MIEIEIFLLLMCYIPSLDFSFASLICWSRWIVWKNVQTRSDYNHKNKKKSYERIISSEESFFSSNSMHKADLNGRLIVIFPEFWALALYVPTNWIDLKFVSQIDLLVTRMSWKFQLNHMCPSRTIEFPKNRRFLQLLWDWSVFWKLHISWRRHSFELKVPAHFSYK